MFSTAPFTMVSMSEVAVRELNQQTGRVLRRVAEGESLIVTDHGRPVAMLTPVPRSKFKQLEALGHIRPPKNAGPDLTRVTAVEREERLDDVLADLRDESV